MSNTFHFHEETALLERLSNGLKKRSQEVVFLVGAPLSAPVNPGTPGVPDVNGVIKLVIREFGDADDQVRSLKDVLEKAGGKRYQAAFQFLQGRRGQQTANEIIRNAV